MSFIPYVVAGLAVLLAVGVALGRADRGERIEMPANAPSQAGAPSVDAMIQAGRKIEAIKLLRAETGLGLKEAKDEVERRMRSAATR